MITTMMKRLGVAVAMTATVAALAGCGAVGSTTTTTTAALGATTTSGAAPSAPAKDAAAKFGDTLTKDGVSVTVAAPTAFTPSASSAAGGKMGAGPSSMLQVTVKNGSDKPIQPFWVILKATSGDAQVPDVFDSANGVLAPTADILPGKTLTWKVAFESPTTKPLDVQVTINFTKVGVYSKA